MLLFKVIDIDLIWISSVANNILFYVPYTIILIKVQDYSGANQLLKVPMVLQQKRLSVFRETNQKMSAVLQMTGFF